MSTMRTATHQALPAEFDRSFEYCAPADGPQLSGDYRVLKKMIERAGLFERQYGYYAIMVLTSWTMLAVGLALLPMARDRGLYLLDAVFLAIVFVQFGYLGHDGAHGEVFRDWKNNHLFCLIQGNLLMGLSTGWWTRKHNLHHSNPNCAGLDGEIEIAGLAFTEAQALHRNGWMLVAAKYQAYTFFPLLGLTAIALRTESVQYILRSKPKHALAEALLVAVHFLLYGWFVFSVLGFSRGVLFILVHQLLFGFCMGLVFAPNHKGMPMIEEGVRVDFLHRQVTTARNITPGRITDWCFGGLNYQIEHHLFPSMPRNRLPEARTIVKAFCREHSIPYAETSVLRSYLEILSYLEGVSRAVRKARPGAAVN
jgi:fatty acid desaturase